MTYDGPEPLNREPSNAALLASFTTAPEIAYDRNHGAIPQLDSSHVVTVSFDFNREDTFNNSVPNKALNVAHLHEKVLSLQDLARLPQHTVACALQCAGNRRHTMRTVLKEVSGIDWFDAAVMNAVWSGPRLIDVLEAAGLPAKLKSMPDNQSRGLKSDDLNGSDSNLDLHVEFASYCTPTQDDSWYGGSISLQRALDPDAEVILALNMNGAPLTPNHGFPVRALVPGVAGARSVKWVDRIRVQARESVNFYQRRDYKVLPAHVERIEQAADWWDRIPSLSDMPVNSVVGLPAPNARVQRDRSTGHIEVSGYALPAGSHGPVEAVDIRIDDASHSWQPAELLDADSLCDASTNHHTISTRWCWRRWRWKGPIEPGRHTIWSRARDRDGNAQDAETSAWNLRGVAYNGYGRVDVFVVS